MVGASDVDQTINCWHVTYNILASVHYEGHVLCSAPINHCVFL